MEIIEKRTPNQRFSIVIRFALLICLVEMFSQATLKHNRYPILGIIGYVVLSIILYNSYNYESMGHMNLVWSCVSIISAFVVSHYLFGEKINRYTILAIIYALLAIHTAHLSDEE